MADDDQPLNAEGAWAQQAEARLPDRREREEIERGLTYGLEAAPTINDRHTYAEVREWLVESGFRDVERTIEHTELFLRGAREPEAIAPFTLRPPSPPYWFARY